MDYAEEEVIAVLMPKDTTGKQQVIGSFRLVHLSPKTVNVTLVPTDATSKSRLKTQGEELNNIYKKIGVTFVIKEDPVLNIDSVVTGNTINSADADLMSTYSEQQQQINSRYKGAADRYVVFVTDKTSSTGQNGYMRLNGQFGYIYQNAPGKTTAHELGHGVFKLEHPQESYPNLLMDKASINGELLSHLDWKQVNDPKLKLYAFQGQSSGEYKGKWMVGKIIQDIRCAYLGKSQSLSFEQDLKYFKDFLEGSKYISKLYTISLGSDVAYKFKIRFKVNAKEKVVLSENIGASEASSEGPGFKSYKLGGLEILTDYTSAKSRGSYTFDEFLKGKDLKVEEDPSILIAPTAQSETAGTILLDEVVIKAINILGDGKIDNEEFEALKNRAVCESSVYSLQYRLKIIKALLKRGATTNEAEEDLILDLMHNTPSQDVDGFLGYIRENEDFLEELSNSIDNAHLFGKEENALRFIAEITNLWKKSSYTSPEKYSYISTKPILEIREGKRVNDALGFKYRIVKDGEEISVDIKRRTRFISFPSTEYSYDMYQPVVVLFSSDDSWSLPSGPIPAYILYLAKNISDNKKAIQAANMSFDVVLTFTGVGNITKLRHVHTAFKGFRRAKAIIGATEVAASTVDLFLDYSDICKGNEATCQKVKLVTFALQLFSLSADIVSTQQMKRYARDAAESANATNTALPQDLANTLEEIGGVRVVNVVEGAGSLDDLVSWASNNGLSHLTQAEIKGTFDLFEGNITFAQKALLSSKEIVAGKTLLELAQHFNLPTIPAPQSLTPYQARVWYSWRKSQISTLVNRSNGLEAAAREAVEMRNTIRTTTRNSMKDTDIANFLNTKEVNMTWEEAMSKYNGNYEEIIQASTRGRGVVDVLFQIPK